MEPLEGIAFADAHLGRPVPLPQAPLPLARWVEVRALGPGAVEIDWNLDDTRPGAPGRLALYVGTQAPEPHELPAAGEATHDGGVDYRRAPLEQAQPSLRPVHELSWQHDGLHLRLTAQGPWERDALVAVAASIRP